MLDKLSDTYAPRPSPGPHKLREFLPLTVFLRNSLKYALTGKEALSIVKQQLIKIDNKVHTDATFSAGFMGASPIRSYRFRLLYDVKGWFAIHRITAEEATYKLLKVRKVASGAGVVSHIAKTSHFVKFNTRNTGMRVSSCTERSTSKGSSRRSLRALSPRYALRTDNKHVAHGLGKGTKLTISEERDLKKNRLPSSRWVSISSYAMLV
ncbi:hypothetical protein C8R44DRAFT_832413 [Mycena epipterygia]|nr:hypothetical protein C8R44DRAFT_832413 [Mycena epipterygia]